MPSSPRILVIGLAWVGDTVMSQSLFKALKAQARDCHLTVMAPAWSEPLLHAMPEVDRVLPMPFSHGELNLLGRWRLAKALAQQFDQAIVLPRAFKAALIPYFAGIPVRTGFLGEWRFGLINDRRAHPGKRCGNYRDNLLRLSELEKLSSNLSRFNPSLQLAQSQTQAVLRQFGLSEPQARSYTVFCPGAAFGLSKRWPYFKELAECCADDQQTVVLLGSPKERALGEEIASVAPAQVINLVGQTRLDEAMHVLQGARLVVSNDSGLMHVAAALDKPLLAIYGSSSPSYTPPLCAGAKIFYQQLPCSPCYQRQCPLGHYDCLRTLSVVEVFTALQERLRLLTATPSQLSVDPV